MLLGGFFIDGGRQDVLGYVKEFTEARFPGQGEKAEEEMGLFISSFADMSQSRKESAFKMTAKVYWNCIGRHEYPTLYLCAKPINDLICSSAASERVWSAYRFIHSRLRSQLGNEKVEKLAFICVNCAMIDKIDQTDYLEADAVLLSGLDGLLDQR